jgi:hypothetical protein
VAGFAPVGARRRQPDFLVPQMSSRGDHFGLVPELPRVPVHLVHGRHRVNPTDTTALTAWAKILIMVQSLASWLTVAIVVCRAVDILS